MRSRSIIFCIVGLISAILSPKYFANTGQIGHLLDFWAGKEISTLSEKRQRQFQNFVVKNLPLGKITDPFLGNPNHILLNKGRAYVWNFVGGSTKSYLIYLNPHTGMVPSAEHAWLFIVNREGKTICRSDFDTGWRMYADTAIYTHVNWLSSPVLIQSMSVGGNGRGPRKIYIGFDHLNPMVVRIEDEKGSVCPLEVSTGHLVGPDFTFRDEKSLRSALTGSNQVQQLNALVWLSGSFQSFSSDRLKNEEGLHRRLVKNVDIAKAIKSLRRSKNEYVKQLANAVQLP